MIIIAIKYEYQIWCQKFNTKIQMPSNFIIKMDTKENIPTE